MGLQHGHMLEAATPGLLLFEPCVRGCTHCDTASAHIRSRCLILRVSVAMMTSNSSCNNVFMMHLRSQSCNTGTSWAHQRALPLLHIGTHFGGPDWAVL